MKINIVSLLVAVPLSISASLCFGAKGAELKPSLAHTGKVIFQDDFSSASLSKPWSVAKGDRQVKDGRMVTVQSDNGVNLTANDGRPDKDKISYRFVTKGASLDLAGVKIWQVAP